MLVTGRCDVVSVDVSFCGAVGSSVVEVVVSGVVEFAIEVVVVDLVVVVEGIAVVITQSTLLGQSQIFDSGLKYNLPEVVIGH